MCTAVRFSDDRGNMYLGRNLDWSVGYGQKVVITPKNYVLNSVFCGKLNVSHPVIGMGIVQEGIPLYFDCGNDAGLAIAGLVCGIVGTIFGLFALIGIPSILSFMHDGPFDDFDSFGPYMDF